MHMQPSAPHRVRARVRPVSIATTLATTLAATLATTLTAAGQAAAQAPCDQIAAVERYTRAQNPPSGAVCATFLSQSGTPGAACHWAFEYRAQAAEDHARALWRAVQTCRPGAEATAAGASSGPAGGADTAPVNHPDSYLLRSWRGADGAYYVSQKDKAADRRTLVFLRFEPS
ncbi:MAG: hypothetical protein AAGF79_14200 [Pseudomonadota bacterium]